MAIKDPNTEIVVLYSLLLNDASHNFIACSQRREFEPHFLSKNVWWKDFMENSYGVVVTSFESLDIQLPI